MQPAIINRTDPARCAFLKLKATAWVSGVVFSFWFLSAFPVHGQSLTRTESLKIAESYVNHPWQSSEKNLRHGKDSEGVEINTPDRQGGQGSPVEDCWTVGAGNTGVPYKWGGFDTLQSFDAGIRSGRAAGDVYTAEKRRKGGAAVSGAAVGIDCSGFISRCWKLERKHSTSMLAGISDKLSSPSDLLPADIMNTPEGHVLLFVKWIDPDKKRALFYEAAPFSKTRACEYDIAEMTAEGYQPMRYRKIHD